MAKKTAAAPRFYEVVFRGKPKVVKAFLKGLMMGAGREVTAFFSWDEGIRHEGRTEKLKEMFGIRATDCHLVVDADGAAYLKKMQKTIAAETGLGITSNRYVRSASMEFAYHAYARRYAEEIQDALQNLPRGLRLKGFEHDEKSDPGARGIEAYSVAHHYEATGCGTIAGRVDLLVEVRRKLSGYPLVDAKEIVLNLA